MKSFEYKVYLIIKFLKNIFIIVSKMKLTVLKKITLITIYLCLFTFVESNSQFLKGIPYDPKTEQTFKIFFSDGYKSIIERQINFKEDGLYENKRLLVKYEMFETAQNLKCFIQSEFSFVPSLYVDKKMFNPKCLVKVKYNDIMTFMGSKDFNCKEIMSYVTKKIADRCKSIKFGPNDKFRKELNADPDNGYWAGPVLYTKIPGSGTASLQGSNVYKLEIDKSFMKIQNKAN